MPIIHLAVADAKTACGLRYTVKTPKTVKSEEVTCKPCRYAFDAAQAHLARFTVKEFVPRPHRPQATQTQLLIAFNLVRNRRNWKNPINRTVAADADLQLIREAVIHFTGSVPEITELPDGRHRVVASGYYLTIGA